MGKKRFTWEYYQKCAEDNFLAARKFLHLSVITLMIDKGFSNETAALFDASFASFHDNVITFNNEGEFLDLNLESASEMTKDEIIEFFSYEISSDSLQLLINDI